MQGVLGNQRVQHLIAHCLNFCHFVRGAETIKEMQNRQAANQGRSMGNQGKVHRFLHRAGAEHGKTGLAHRHHITVITKNRQGLTG